MASTGIPSLLAIAKIKTATKPAQDRLLEVFPTLVKHCADNEPETLSYYFFTSSSPDDHALYGFEGYPSVAALVDVHSQSDVFKRQGKILQDEKLATVDVDQFKPLGGFILRPGQTQKPLGQLIINKLKVTPESKAQLVNYAKYVEKEEAEGCPTYVLMEHAKNEGEVWTFERYETREFYLEKHVKSQAYQELFGNGQLALSTSEFEDSNIGFLTK